MQRIPKSWGKVYKGNFEDRQQKATEFVIKYSDKIYLAPEFQIDDIKAADVRTACTTGKKSMGGLDQWTPADFGLLPDKAYEWLATLLNAIEHT